MVVKTLNQLESGATDSLALRSGLDAFNDDLGVVTVERGYRLANLCMVGPKINIPTNFQKFWSDLADGGVRKVSRIVVIKCHERSMSAQIAQGLEVGECFALLADF